MFFILDKLWFGLFCLDKFFFINFNFKSVISIFVFVFYSVSLDYSVFNFIFGGLFIKEFLSCGLEINLVMFRKNMG